MTDLKILKYYLNPMTTRERQQRAGFGQFYVIRERMSPFGREAYYLVYRSTRGVQFEEISKKFFDVFRLEADRWRKGFTHFLAPDGADSRDELIRYYLNPETVRQKEQSLCVTQFCLLRLAQRCYLGRRSMWEFQIHYVTPEFYEGARNDVLRRAKELKAEHWIPDRTIENLDERLLTDDPSQHGWKLQKPDIGPASVPIQQAHPHSYHHDNGRVCWCWRRKFGGPPSEDSLPF